MDHGVVTLNDPVCHFPMNDDLLLLLLLRPPRHRDQLLFRLRCGSQLSWFSVKVRELLPVIHAGLISQPANQGRVM